MVAFNHKAATGGRARDYHRRFLRSFSATSGRGFMTNLELPNDES
jgi:hypothetical protein